MNNLIKKIRLFLQLVALSFVLCAAKQKSTDWMPHFLNLMNNLGTMDENQAQDKLKTLYRFIDVMERDDFLLKPAMQGGSEISFLSHAIHANPTKTQQQIFLKLLERMRQLKVLEMSKN